MPKQPPTTALAAHDLKRCGRGGGVRAATLRTAPRPSALTTHRARTRTVSKVGADMGVKPRPRDAGPPPAGRHPRSRFIQGACRHHRSRSIWLCNEARHRTMSRLPGDAEPYSQDDLPAVPQPSTAARPPFSDPCASPRCFYLLTARRRKPRRWLGTRCRPPTWLPPCHGRASSTVQ